MAPPIAAEKIRILVTEDVSTDVELELRELKRAGLRVDHRVVDTEEGFRRALMEFQPDVILSDFSMPHFDGMSALALAREVAPETPFIFVSGTIGEEYAIRAPLKNGASDYVLKTNLVRLPPAVERAMQDKEARAHRKRVEEVQRRFRVALDASGDIIVLIDRATMRFVDVNNTMCTLLGYTRAELLEMGPQDVLPFSRAELELSYDNLLSDPSGYGGGGWSSHYRCKNGTLLPCESTRRVVYSGGENMIVVISRDVRARIAAEEALRKSNERFNLAVRATNDVIWDWDLPSDRLWWNENLAEAFGHRAAEFEPGVAAWYGLIHPEDRDRVVTELHRMLELGGEAWSDEYRLRRSDGSYDSVYDRGHVIRNDAGKALRMIGAKADVTARKEAEERLSYLAQFDTLTGLPNRHLFRDRLAQALVQAGRSNWPVGVMLVDLDRFKQVNDTLGHAAGDTLLKEVAARLSECVRTGDTVGRFSSDEFGVALTDLDKAGDSGRVAQKIMDALAEPFMIDGAERYITSSIGISVYPADNEDAEALIANSSAAMNRAKEEGRNNYQYFTREMNERVHKRVQTELALRRAMERREFLLHYQPKVDLASGTICGFEALLRWQHPERGLVSPLEFIPVLEDTGLIVPVGEWIVAEVCRQIGRWKAAGIVPRPVAVNLSARQFQEEGLLASVTRILEECAVESSMIQFEITESMIMKDHERAVKALGALRDCGIKMSIDDFGTGYSSLAHLKSFPLDALKIDRAFVREVDANTDDAAIALAIIAMAHSMKLKVIAEGVETESQLRFLRERGCDEIQGYYFAKPLIAAEATRSLVEAHRLKV